MRKTESIIRDIINQINKKYPKSINKNIELELLKAYISNSRLFNGEKKKLYRIINKNKK